MASSLAVKEAAPNSCALKIGLPEVKCPGADWWDRNLFALDKGRCAGVPQT